MYYPTDAILETELDEVELHNATGMVRDLVSIPEADRPKLLAACLKSLGLIVREDERDGCVAELEKARLSFDPRSPVTEGLTLAIKIIKAKGKSA